MRCRNRTDNSSMLLYNSSAIYRSGEGFCTRAAGTFFKNSQNASFLNYIDEYNFEFKSTYGDKCGENDSYYLNYKFFDAPHFKESESVQYNSLDIPDINMQSKCHRELKIYTNFEELIDHLLIQKFMNDYWIFTGIVFLIIGFYLMILAQNLIATKFVVCTVFGEIFTFTLACGLIGIPYNIEWILFVVGIFLGIFIGYFSLGNTKLFRAILSIISGYILGLIIFDIIFAFGNYQLAEVLLTDTILVFIGMSVVIIYLAPEYHYFHYSIIGSYIFIRGVSVLMHKAGKYGRYRELQLMLYLLNNFEFDLAQYCFKNYWPIYFIYDILMFLFGGASIYYYLIKAVGKDEDEEEKDEKNQEEKLIGGKKTTVTNEDDQDLN